VFNLWLGDSLGALGASHSDPIKSDWIGDQFGITLKDRTQYLNDKLYNFFFEHGISFARKVIGNGPMTLLRQQLINLNEVIDASFSGHL